MERAETTTAASGSPTTVDSLGWVRSVTGRIHAPSALGFVVLGTLLGLVLGRLLSRAPDGEQSTDVLATVGNERVTRADVERMTPEGFLNLRRQRQELTEKSLQQAIRLKLVEVEAATRGIAPAELAQQEVYGKTPEPTEDEIENVYQRSGSTAPRVQSTRSIKTILKRQAQNRRYEEFLTELRSRHPVEERLQPLRFELKAEGFPTKGPTDAPVTIVEFSDFQCPFCQRQLGPLGQVLDAYQDQVRLVYRQFPITSIHPAAQKAAEASLCAFEQNHFWELHDAMFAAQRDLSPASLKEKAKGLGLNEQEFAECLDSGKYAKQVETDREEGRALGVTGTPALFVNGRYLGGSQSAEDIAAVVLDELRRAGRTIEPRRLEPIRTTVEADGYPAKGPANAPVTIVEFGDFQCPFCRQILGPLEQVLEKYGDKVRLVYRQFPIEALHPQAPKAAEASLCAAAQNRFWEIHDAMFAEPRNLDIANLKRIGRSIGLDAGKFDACLDGGTYAEEVEREIEAGRSLGVTGTPALFINGRFLSGFQRFETLAGVIEDELANPPK